MLIPANKILKKIPLSIAGSRFGGYSLIVAQMGFYVMLGKSGSVVRNAAVALMLLGGTASAETLITPPSTMGPGNLANPIQLNFLYEAAVSFNGSEIVNDVYQFVFNSTPTTTTSATLICGGQAGCGFSNLNLAWTGPGGINQSFNATLGLTTTLLTVGANGTYSLTMSGQALSNGGSYDVQLFATSGNEGRPTPLPTALPLFATVLGGAGLLARWRKKRTLKMAAA